MGIAFTCAALLHAAGCAAVGSQGISDHELRAEKRGRVVDADTGAGISGAKVIALWRESNSGSPHIASASNWCALQKVTTTADDGSYAFPDVTHELDLSERGTSSSDVPALGTITVTHDTTLLLLVFKPGYVRVAPDIERTNRSPYDPTESADDLKVLSHMMTGSSEGCYPPPSQVCLTTFVWQHGEPALSHASGGAVGVKSITMRKVELSPPEVWIYYNTILSTSQCHAARNGDLNQPEIAEMEHSTSTLVRPMPCMMQPAATITAAAATSYAGLVGGKEIFTSIEKFGETTWPWKDTTAEVLCKASRVEEQAP